MYTGMDVIFVDIDGTLNTWADGPLAPIRPEHAARLDRIVQTCAPLYVVLSSAHRKHVDLLRAARRRFVIYGQTGTLAHNLPRGNEIDEWLERQRRRGVVFTNHAIIDDLAEFHPHQHWFAVDRNVGLTDETADRVIEHILGHRAQAQ